MKGVVTSLVWPEPCCNLEYKFLKVKIRKKYTSYKVRTGGLR